MIAYDRLSQIIPSDLALANKALQVSLQQISGISNMTTSQLANAVSAVTTNANLPLINQQQQPISQSCQTFYTQTMGIGTGECGTILPFDTLGTAVGAVNSDRLANVVEQLSTMDTTYLQLCYTTMTGCLNGDYTTDVAPNYTIEIPSGLPGEGTYGPFTTEQLAQDTAFTTGLIPAVQTEIANLVAAYPAQVAYMNTDFGDICQQIGNEQDLQVRSGLNFGNFFANLQATAQTATLSLVQSLPTYGQDTTKGGTAQFFELLADYNPIVGNIAVGVATVSQVDTFAGVTVNANISGANIPGNTYVVSFNNSAKTLVMNQEANATVQPANLVVGSIGGQAVVGVLRQGINQTALDNAGIQTNFNVPLTPSVPPQQANLIPSGYTPQQATGLIVK